MNLLLAKGVTNPHITEASLLCFLSLFCWSGFVASIIHWARDSLACEKKLKPWVRAGGRTGLAEWACCGVKAEARGNAAVSSSTLHNVHLQK